MASLGHPIVADARYNPHKALQMERLHGFVKLGCQAKDDVMSSESAESCRLSILCVGQVGACLDWQAEICPRLFLHACYLRCLLPSGRPRDNTACPDVTSRQDLFAVGGTLLEVDAAESTKDA